MASGGTLTPGSRQDLAQFPPEVLRAAVDEAHRLGLRVTVHAHAVTAIADAVAAGVDGLEHVTFWTEDGVDAPAHLIQLIARQRITVGATVGFVPVPGMEPPPAVAARMPAIIANTRRLYEAGAPVVAGTDAGIAPVHLPNAAPDLLAATSASWPMSGEPPRLHPDGVSDAARRPASARRR